MIVHRVEHNRRRLAMHVHVCESRVERRRGLLLRRCPDRRTAWLLPRCSTVHTIGVTFSIDVLFCDDSGRIIHIVKGLRPFRLARHAAAASAWELPAGGVDQWGWRVGDKISPC
jgi:uncharacterized membrane protein (UPF0127 family)